MVEVLQFWQVGRLLPEPPLVAACDVAVGGATAGDATACDAAGGAAADDAALCGALGDISSDGYGSHNVLSFSEAAQIAAMSARPGGAPLGS